MNTSKLKCIGKGAFSTVYQKNKNTVLIKSNDNVKECMSLGWFSNSKLFPSIECVGTSDCGEFKFYEEKFYPKVKGLKNVISAFEYEFYKALRNLKTPHYNARNYDNLDHWREQFESLPGKFHVKKTALLEALDGLSNYGTDICFEISPRNVATQGKKLVLLDCFFMAKDLDRLRKKQSRRNGYNY